MANVSPIHRNGVMSALFTEMANVIPIYRNG